MFNFFRRKKQEPSKLVKGQVPQRKPLDQRLYSKPSFSKQDEETKSDFGTSLAIGYATDNPILGGLIGGDIIGGIIGAELNNSSETTSTPDTDSNSFGGFNDGDFGGGGAGGSWDDSSSSSSDSSSYDSESSYDIGSSYDSSSDIGSSSSDW